MTNAMRFEGPDPTNVIGRRVLAFIVDQLIVGVAIVIGLALSSVELEPVGLAGVGPTQPVGPEWQVLLISLIPLGYVVGVVIVLQGIAGYTLGKLAVGIRCVRFDGRPPGVLKALVRAVPFYVGTAFIGCIWWAVCLLFMTFTKGHRRLGDLLGGTFVIGDSYMGRIISIGADRAAAGPESVYADEVPGMPSSSVAALQRPKKPIFDKRRGTYVVWNEKRNRLMEFDKANDSWRPIE